MTLPTHPALQQIHLLDRAATDFDKQLDSLLHAKAYEECVQSLEAGDLMWLIDYLDKALDCLDPSCPASRKCLREMKSICGAKAILPTSYQIPPELLTVEPYMFASGTSSNVYEGTLNGSKVCVKLLRDSSRDAVPTVTKMLCQEAVLWKRLKHPNILSLLGVTIHPPRLISDWVSGEDLPSYIEANPDADRVGLLSDVAKGLDYLHSCNVVHAGLKGPNILVGVDTSPPCARIADFGITIVTRNLNSRRAVTHQNMHNPLWSAPEVLNGENPLKESDIYSFSMVMFEVFADCAPFSDRPEYMAVLAILGGERPSRPTHPSCTDELWALIQRCWDDEPISRPGVCQVLEILLSSRVSLHMDIES